MTLREKIESLWDKHGECQSCGWHALLSEYFLSDRDFADCIESGVFRLPCLSKDDEDRSSHRGVQIDIGKNALG